MISAPLSLPQPPICFENKFAQINPVIDCDEMGTLYDKMVVRLRETFTESFVQRYIRRIERIVICCSGEVVVLMRDHAPMAMYRSLVMNSDQFGYGNIIDFVFATPESSIYRQMSMNFPLKKQPPTQFPYVIEIPRGAFGGLPEITTDDIMMWDDVADDDLLQRMKIDVRTYDWLVDTISGKYTVMTRDLRDDAFDGGIDDMARVSFELEEDAAMCKLRFG